MEVRDAVEADADDIAAISGLPSAAAGQLVHDRTVRVVESDSEIRGFVAFDAGTDTVHVTQLAGDADAVGRLLDEPARFAEREGMPVEAVVPAADEETTAAVEAYGFEGAGSGPRFDGEPTRRYRLEP